MRDGVRATTLDRWKIAMPCTAMCVPERSPRDLDHHDIDTVYLLDAAYVAHTCGMHVAQVLPCRAPPRHHDIMHSAPCGGNCIHPLLHSHSILLPQSPFVW
jgi:hypothetical protein